MSTARLRIDRLWQCLCPSISRHGMRRLLNVPFMVSRPRPATCAAIRSVQNPSHLVRHRAYNTVKTQGDRADNFKRWKRETNSFNRESDRAEDVGELAVLEDIPIGDTLDILARLRTRAGSYRQIVTLVDHLVYERGVKLDLFLYETLLMANADPQGSALAVKHLLHGMESDGIQRTPTIYLGALRALAVHPDYVLRGKLLDEMRMLWVSPSAGCQEAITLGLLRDGQYELALDSFEELVESGNPVPNWLYETLIYVFSDAGFHDESLTLLRHHGRSSDGSLSTHAWFHVLESCSKAFHYEGTAYIWNEMVTEGRLNPPDGTVLSVANAASRYGDVPLATDALRVLSDRNTRLAVHHFEALLDSYVSQGDVTNALRVLCIMAAAGNEADSRSTQPLFRRLVGSPGSLADASKALVHLTSERPVPLSAFNVVLEATVVSLGLEQAMDLYRSVRQICGKPPDLATFAILLGRCGDGNMARFLVKELESFSTTRHLETYELLVRGSVLFSDTDLALDYVSEMSVRNRGWWVTDATAKELVERGILDQNPRIWQFVEESKAKGIAISTALLQDLKGRASRRAATDSGEGP